MRDTTDLPIQEETKEVLKKDYEFLENYKHSTGNPIIKRICTHRQHLILQYLAENPFVRL